MGKKRSGIFFPPRRRGILGVNATRAIRAWKCRQVDPIKLSKWKLFYLNWGSLVSGGFKLGPASREPHGDKGQSCAGSSSVWKLTQTPCRAARGVGDTCDGVRETQTLTQRSLSSAGFLCFCHQQVFIKCQELELWPVVLSNRVNNFSDDLFLFPTAVTHGETLLLSR